MKNVNAAQLVPILRPLMPQYGHLAAYPASNILIISDRASNVNRIMRIIRRIDQAGDSDVEIVPLQNATAAEIVRIINYALPAAAGRRGRRDPMKLVADERSNSVLDQRRAVAAAAHQGADRAPRHAAARPVATRRCATCATRTPRRSRRS